MVVDLNTIPQAAIDSVEIITGGAGSTYGADAVSGVVNFKLKRNFEGISTDAQFGMTERSDGEQTSVNMLMGSNFAEDKGNAMIGISYSRREEVIREDVPFFEAAYSDPYLAAQQFNNYAGFVSGIPGNITNSPAGGSTTQAAVDTVFGRYGYVAGDVPNNSRVLFQPGRDDAGRLAVRAESGPHLRPALAELSGRAVPRRQVRHLERQHRRQDAHVEHPGHGRHAAGAAHSSTRCSPTRATRRTSTPRCTFRPDSTRTRRTRVSATSFRRATSGGVTVPFGTGIYTPSRNPNGSTNAAYMTGGAYGLNCGPVGGCTNSEAFPVPKDLADLLANRPTVTNPVTGITTDANSNWNLNYNLTYMGKRGLENTQNTYEILAGLRGKLPVKDWTYDFFMTRGDTRSNTSYEGFIDAASYQALIALPNYGQGQDFNNGRLGVLAHCTSGLNPFIAGPKTQDCIDIIDSNAKLTSQLEQQQFELDIQGGLFELPAGEARFAAGMDYRKNTYQYLPDHGMQTTNIVSVVAGQFDTTETRGDIAVKEVYAEFLAPVLKDLPGAKSSS